MDNPFSLLETFTVDHAARAVAGTLTPTTSREQDIIGIIQSKLIGDINTRKIPANIVPVYRQTSLAFVTPSGRSFPAEYEPTSQVDMKKTTINRSALLAWCEQQNIRPPLLFPDPPPPDKPLHSSERSTLLAIIRALAELHGIKADSGAYRKEAEALLKELAEKKITEPCNDKTLAKHLKTSFEAR